MSSIMDYVKGKEFSKEKEVESFPDGKTELDLNEISEPEKRVVKFENGEEKIKWVITVGEKKHWAGVQVMQGIAEATEAGFSRVVVTKKGQGMNTKYSVMPIQEPSQKGDA